MIRLSRIKKIVIGALLIRLTTLIIIFVVTPDWSVGLSSRYTVQDDVRYEAGAMRYAETANGILDKDAFTSAYAAFDDYTGYISNIFRATPLWYWIVCITYYIFGSVIFVRILNIIISVISVYLLYKLVMLIYDKDTAYTAAKLLAFLPYPVVFSCFSYKDSFVMALTIFLLYQALNFRITKKFKIKSLMATIIVAVALFLVRSGLSAILVTLCFAIALLDGEKLNRRKLIWRVFIVLVAVIIGSYIINRSMGEISLKLRSYITDRNVESLGGLSLVSVTRIREIYKLPLTFLFAVVMPIGFSGKISTWLDIVSVLNVCMAPIAIGAFVDLFLHRKKEWVFLGSCLVYYSITIIASIGIYRHYYSLLFIPILLFSHQRHNGNRLSNSICIIGSSLYFFALLAYVIL